MTATAATAARAEVGVGKRARGLDGERRDSGLIDDWKKDSAAHFEIVTRAFVPRDLPAQGGVCQASPSGTSTRVGVWCHIDGDGCSPGCTSP